MSIKIRPSAARGHANHGWLDSFHTFSFADYHDPDAMGFGPLRVINEDRVAPGAGFATHGHRNMEILSYVLEGALQHRDSTGGGGVLRPGDVQTMSAGSGVRHSEFNASATEPAHFLQIWIQPDEQNVAPGYGQRHFDAGERSGKLRLIASPDGAEDSLPIHQDARVFASLIDEGQRVALTLKPGRKAWVQVATGAARVNGAALSVGDGAAIDDVESLEIEGADSASQILVFDLP
jgi:redox-sensitive bicupin YhaK (pirin superfamily)